MSQIAVATVFGVLPMRCVSLGHEYHIAPTDSPLKSSNRPSAAY